MKCLICSFSLVYRYITPKAWPLRPAFWGIFFFNNFNTHFCRHVTNIYFKIKSYGYFIKHFLLLHFADTLFCELGVFGPLGAPEAVAF